MPVSVPLDLEQRKKGAFMKSVAHNNQEANIVQEILDLDLSELQFKSMGIEPQEVQNRPENMIVFEIGLDEFFACLMVHTLLNSNISKDSWMLLKQTDSLPSPVIPVENSYCLAFDERAASGVEKAIKLADKIESIVLAVEDAKKKSEKAKDTLSLEEIRKIAERQAKVSIRRRDKMWTEIDRGLELLLSDRNNSNNPLPDDEDISFCLLSIPMRDGTVRNITLLTLHGHQLRKWVRQSQFFRLPSEIEIIMMGHYHIKMAELLLAHGAKVNINAGEYKYVSWPSGETPLHEAAGAGHIEMVNFLISKGADVNSRGDGGCPPLHRTLLCSDPEKNKAKIKIRRILQIHGADPTITCDRHQSTKSISSHRRKTQRGFVVELLTGDIQ